MYRKGAKVLFRHIIISGDCGYEPSLSNRLIIRDVHSRGWLMDVLNCVNKICKQQFNLQDVYYFDKELQLRHPENHNIKPKIRQQLQFLRDKGFVQFLGNGQYLKLN